MDELYHHGIKGQKWGERNGPPYPLERKTYSGRAERIRKRARKYKLEADKVSQLGPNDSKKAEEISTKYQEKRHELATKGRELTKKANEVEGRKVSRELNKEAQHVAQLWRDHERVLNDYYGGRKTKVDVDHAKRLLDEAQANLDKKIEDLKMDGFNVKSRYNEYNIDIGRARVAAALTYMGARAITYPFGLASMAGSAAAAGVVYRSTTGYGDGRKYTAKRNVR